MWDLNNIICYVLLRLVPTDLAIKWCCTGSDVVYSMLLALGIMHCTCMCMLSVYYISRYLKQLDNQIACSYVATLHACGWYCHKSVNAYTYALHSYSCMYIVDCTIYILNQMWAMLITYAVLILWKVFIEYTYTNTIRVCSPTKMMVLRANSFLDLLVATIQTSCISNSKILTTWSGTTGTSKVKRSASGLQMIQW